MTTDEFKVFQQIALLGTATLLERIVPKEKLESEYEQDNSVRPLILMLIKYQKARLDPVPVHTIQKVR